MIARIPPQSQSHMAGMGQRALDTPGQLELVLQPCAAQSHQNLFLFVQLAEVSWVDHMKSTRSTMITGAQLLERFQKLLVLLCGVHQTAGEPGCEFSSSPTHGIVPNMDALID